MLAEILQYKFLEMPVTHVVKIKYYECKCKSSTMFRIAA